MTIIKFAGGKIHEQSVELNFARAKYDKIKRMNEDETEKNGAENHAEHHHHGWLGRHFCRLNFRKLGWFGMVVFVLHILFHVVEVLLIPAILVWLGMK